MGGAVFAAIAVLVIIMIVMIVLIALLARRHRTNVIKDAVVVFDPGMKSNSGKISGTVTFHQESPDAPTLVRIGLSGFAPGKTQAIHIHQYGDLSAGCDSACQHYNPGGRRHGSQELDGEDRHAGDLCNNITADASGTAAVSYTDPLVSLSGPHSVIGRSVVVHADPDDQGRYRDEQGARGEGSATTGNAGRRIACAVIGIAAPP